MRNTMDEIKLVNYLAGELDNHQRGEVELWLEDPANKAEFEKIKQLWEETATLKDAGMFQAEKSWDNFKGRLNGNGQQHSGTRKLNILRYAVAASLLLVIGMAAFFLFSEKGVSNSAKLVSGIHKPEAPYTLPDGTKVYLNRNTTLAYQNDFNKETRTVTLTGEAFFDVAKNASKPFIIRTAATDIRVVGTSFNVLAYPGSDSVQVSVETGIVEMFSTIGENSKIRLTVGNEGTYVKSDKRFVASATFDANVMAWRTNKLKFRDADMEYVTSALKHAFGKEIRLESANLKKCRLTANFNNQSLEIILKVIQETFGVKCSNQGDVYILSGPGC